MNNEFYVDTEFEVANEENEEDLKQEVSLINEAVIWATDWTTETLNMQLLKGNIDLRPQFQRRDAWDDQRKSKLIESLILGFPVPPIVLAEIKCKRNSYVVVDGKQRLLSIRRFYAGSNLQPNNNDSFEPLTLKGLDILDKLNGRSYNYVQSNCREYIDSLDNQPIRTVVVKNWMNEEFLYAIFHRLNTGSKPLSPQELRQSLMPGDFLTYLDDETAKSDVIMKMLNNKKADPRMRDIELALRYFAYKFSLDKYNGNLKDFLDLTCRNLNTQWCEKSEEIKKEFSELENAINFSQEVFGVNSPFSRYTNGESHSRFNRSIFEIFVFYFSVPAIREAISQKSVLLDAFKTLNDNSYFVDSVDTTTKTIERVYTRFSMFFNLLTELDDIKGKGIQIPKILCNDGKLSLETVVS